MINEAKKTEILYYNYTNKTQNKNSDDAAICMDSMSFCAVVSRTEITYTYGSNIIVVREVMSGHITTSLHCESQCREVNNNVVHSAEIHTKNCLS
jgi:hypothetical protein